MRYVALLVLCAVGLEAFWIYVRSFEGSPASVVETIASLLLASPVYLVSLYLTLRNSPRVHDKRLIPLILLAAGAFRLTIWPVFPLTSEDPFRYRWEGKLQAAGGNPYMAAPGDPQWIALRDETYPRVVGKDFRAVYGPLLQLVEHVTYQGLNKVEPVKRQPFRQVFWFKLPAALADLGVIATLLWWLRARGLDPARVVAYAWCPLPVWEFWANGHNDSILLFLLALSLGLGSWRKVLGSFVLLGMAAATKLWPAALIPKLWLTHGRKWQVLAIAPVWIALALPFVSDVSRNAQFVSGFLGGWRNNDLVFGGILALAGDLYVAKYVTFGLLAAAVAVITFYRRLSVEAAAVALICAMLALSSNIHPWYLTWIAPFLAFYPSPTLLLLVSLVPLHYVVLLRYFALGEWDGVSPWRWVVYVPVCAMLAAELVVQYRKRRLLRVPE